MDDTIATASKSILQIKRRKFSHKIFRGIQTILGGKTKSPNSFAFYPRIKDPDIFADLCNRTAWYWPKNSSSGGEIHIIGYKSIKNTPRSRSLPNQVDYSSDHIDFIFHDSLNQIKNQVERLLVWDKSHRLDRHNINYIRKTDIIDPTYYSTVEAITWNRVFNHLRTDFNNTSIESFHHLENTAEGKSKSYVFATGPSLDNVFDLNIPDDALSVICNSIVKDDKLLNHLNPDILVFADPVFHFGPSRYAHEFREDAATAMKKYDCIAVVPQEYHSLLVSHYPELSNQVIGLQSVNADEPIYPTHDRLKVMGTSNIMTLYMLPIAASLTNDIHIVGADGRKENESYFWEHSDTAQYDDELMKTVAETHPSFFRDRVYEDYYDQHVETLTEMIEQIESQGARVSALTDSYVPCLAERRVDPDKFDS